MEFLEKRWWVVLVVIALGFGGYLLFNNSNSEPGKYDEFAACLNEKGAVFYGAFWCSHCQNQKQMFGKSMSKVNYVECSTPDGNAQLKICQDKNIEGYPTWEFADGERMSGEVPFETLSEKTGCGLPE